ncbi:Haloalkane dehalogenase [Gimesia alba]|uniref:Haloalkane dehalogenase n=1 Tax=Gimesia alba TaxID=2527973 RepID=A0A517RN21_9PLAN|nr:alpha/beta fold hydrolase [Gimesia alba]QDT45212.1 Haloalkane dehalogenase [Gimesia alba]
MKEFIFPIENDWMYARHSVILPDQPTVLCIHGLGDSGLSFQELATQLCLHGMNVVIPDLLGYGRSSAAKDYSFDAHIARLWNLVDHLGLPQIVLVGHSMGGDIATRMCKELTERVTNFINIEGNLTEFGDWRVKRTHFGAEMGPIWGWVNHVG